MIETTTFQKRFAALQQWYRDNLIEVILGSAAGTGLRAAYGHSQGDRATLVIVSGRTEFIEKYLEVCSDLTDMGYSICIYDHCGQGGSGRLLDDTQKGHIDRFDTYVTDLHRVIDHLRAERLPAPYMLVGHSMGAAIGALAALRRPEQIDKLVLLAPMFSINTNVSLPDFLVEILAAAACRIGLGERYAPTTGPYNPDRKFQGNVLTSDRFRFEFNCFLASQLKFEPLGGPTIRWLHEAFKAMRELRRHGDLISQPVLTIAAENDQVTDPADAARFACASANRIYRKYPLQSHELFMERDEIRNDVLTQMDLFLRGA